MTNNYVNNEMANDFKKAQRSSTVSCINSVHVVVTNVSNYANNNNSVNIHKT